MRTYSQRGSAIIMLFIAVALFGLVAYAFLQGSRGNLNMITNEASKAEAYKGQDCANAVSMAAKRLEARGCSGMVSYNGDGSNPNAGAPTDGSCSIYHPNGGGVKNCNDAPTVCSGTALSSLNSGEACGGVAYVANVNGHRLYTTTSDAGTILFSNWGNFVLNATSTTDGAANTDKYISAGGPGDFPAAETCRALGPEWYIPTMNELAEMYNEKDTGIFNGTYQGDNYISSEEYGVPGIDYAMNAYSFLWGNTSTASKGNPVLLRCVRQD